MQSRLAQGTLLACGVWMTGLGLYFIFIRPALLPEDLRYFGRTLDEITATAPQLLRWLRHVFTVMGGYMIAAGVLTVSVVAHLSREVSMAGVLALLLAGFSSVVLMSAVNFSIDSDYKWLLLMPALLWIAGLTALGLTYWRRTT